MERSAVELVQRISERVLMPEVYLDLRALINDSGSKIDDYVSVVAQDPALAARIVNIANSAFFGNPGKVQSLELAISYIGVIQLHDLLLGSLAIRSFSSIPSDVVNWLDFWKFSFQCGIASRILAKKCEIPASERLFVSGLLHDVGHVVIYITSPEMAQEALFRAEEQAIPIYLVERDLFGFDYAQVGSELMRLWNLPDSYHETTEYHPEPIKASKFRVETSIVHVARHIALSNSSLSDRHSPPEKFDPIVWALTNLSELIIEDVRKEARQHLSEVMRMLFPNPQVAATDAKPGIL